MAGKEYIEREALGIGKCNPEVFEDKGYAKGWNAAIDIIQNAPAADVRPVVNTCETCGYKTEHIRVKPYDGACRYWKLHSIKNEEWCCHWKQREES